MMDEDNLKQLWLNSGKEHRVEINNDMLIASLANKLKGIEKKIRRRDRREIFICVCLIPLFGWWTITVPQLQGKIGCIIIIAACLLVIFKLMRARRINIQNGIASEVQHKLIVSQQLLRQQIKLLQTILWWYLLPFFPGVMLFYFASVTSTLSKVIYIILVAAVYGYIYYLNKRAVKKHLKPLEERVTKILNDLSAPESESQLNDQ
jgi:hypothetical protein